MRFISKIDGGHTPSGKPLMMVGENTLSYRDLTINDREFIDAMRTAGMIEVLEEDPPADVIPIRRPVWTPTESQSRPRPKTRVRKKKAG